MKYLRNVLTLALLLALTTIASPSEAAIASKVTIERFVYDGQVYNDYDEYVKICNISGGSIDLAEDAGGGSNPWRFGEAETMGDTAEAMYELQGTLSNGACFIVASNANNFNVTFGFLPDYEMRTTSAAGGDNGSVPNLPKVTGFTATWGLNNGGDNITLWQHDGSSTYIRQDEVAYGSTSTDYTGVGLDGTSQISCPGGSPSCAITRNNVSTDTDKMADDFNTSDNPNAITLSSLAARAVSTRPFAWPPAVLAAAALAGLLLAERRR